ncbi:hypothetical protein ACQY0O_003357 [Thecaphora frezii]
MLLGQCIWALNSLTLPAAALASTSVPASSSRSSCRFASTALDSLSLALVPCLSSPQTPRPLSTHRAHRTSPDTTRTQTASAQRVQSSTVSQRSRAISQLHTALETGTTDDIFQAFARIPRDAGGQTSAAGDEPEAVRSSLTYFEMRAVLRRLTSDTPRLQEGLMRLLAVVEEIRQRKRWALLRVEDAAKKRRHSERARLLCEARDWDRLLDTPTINAIISFTGRCVRSAGPAEIDEALSLLIDGGLADLNAGGSSASNPPPTHAEPRGMLGHRLGPRDLRYPGFQELQKTLSPSFPDRTTYNTLLDIVSRSVHRFRPKPGGSDHNDVDHALDEPLSPDSLMSRSSHGEGSASRLASNMQRLGLDADHGDYTMETAEKIFHALLDRMRFVSKISPDRITYNIILNMYCRLGRWHLIRETVDSMMHQHLLDVVDVNAVMWRWVSAVKGREERLQRTREAERLYRAMRNNLLELEKRRRKPEEGEVVTAELAATDEEFALLPWSHHDEPATGKSTRSPTAASDKDQRQFGRPRATLRDTQPRAESTDAIERILPVEDLPAHIIPDGTTYALLIKLQTFAGQFSDALSTFRDMLSTPKVRVVRDANGNVSILDETGFEREYRPTASIFCSFFRGFAKHGRPMRLVHFDKFNPSESAWEEFEEGDGAEPVHREEAESLSDWNVRTFGEMFEAFLRLKPYPGPSGDPDPPALKPLVPGEGWEGEAEDLSKLPDGGSSTSELASSLRTMAESILSIGKSDQLPWHLGIDATTAPEGEIAVVEKKEACKAPSSNELFFILTAMRRVSGDHAAWTLATWQKVEEKFGPDGRRGMEENGLLSRTDGWTANSMNWEGWTGFKPNARIQRVLDYLEEKGRAE